MSYATLISFKSGKADGSTEFSNSWGGAARIWTALFDAYIPKKHKYDSWVGDSTNGDRRLWDLATRQDLELFERSVHAFTFDRFYVRKEHFSRMANDLRSFAQKHPTTAMDHLPAFAKWLDESTAEATALYATSVSENPWYRRKLCPTCGNESDESEPIPLSEGTEVYDWIEQINQKDK